MDILELGGEGLGSLQGRLCVPRKKKVGLASFAFSLPSCRASVPKPPFSEVVR